MRNQEKKVFVGYDSREDIAWQVCRHSVQRHSSPDFDVRPLRQSTLRELGLYTRPLDPNASTEFSLIRFLTTYVAAHDGWPLFVDCDFVFTQSPDALFDGLGRDKAVYVVKHDYVPANAIKMDGRVQTVYPRKNWSSFMVFNGAHPMVKAPTPAIVNTAPPAHLHRLAWVRDDNAIGELPRDWNFLEGEHPVPERTPAAIHFTNGGPWFEQRRDVAFADIWRDERDLFLRSRGREVLHAAE